MQHLHYAYISDQNQRDKNEDSFLIFSIYPFSAASPLTILSVADGMGGHEYGDYVSQESLRRMSVSLFEQLTVTPALNCFVSEDSFNSESLSNMLLNALKQTNAHVQRMVATNNWSKAGSTIVLAAIHENSVVVVNLGDSPMLHYSLVNDTLLQITLDHTIAGALLRGGLISPEMARIHEGGDRLEFFLGNDSMPRAAPIYHVMLSSGDLLLLCSDGISGSLSVAEIRHLLDKSYTPDPWSCDLQSFAEQILDASLSAGESDNQTLILWRHEGQP